MIAAMLHGGYGFFEALSAVDGDSGSDLEMRARLNLSLVIMGVLLLTMCFRGTDIPLSWRIAVGVCGALGFVRGLWPAPDQDGIRRWVRSPIEGVLRLGIIAAGTWTIFLAAAGQVPVWVGR